MTTVVKADDKHRIVIRGTQKRRQYLVTAEGDGWRVMPAREVPSRQKRRQWRGSKISLAQHLRALAVNGLRVERAENSTEAVGPCRF